MLPLPKQYKSETGCFTCSLKQSEEQSPFDSHKAKRHQKLVPLSISVWSKSCAETKVDQKPAALVPLSNDQQLAGDNASPVKPQRDLICSSQPVDYH